MRTRRIGAVRAIYDTMPFPLSLTFRDMDPSPALEEFVGQWAAKLDHFSDRIERCHVVIEIPHQRHRQGQRVHVRIALSIPGPDVVVSHEHPLDAAHEDAFVAVRDAFQAARRQLEDRMRRLRQDVKTHIGPEHGRISYLDAEGEWGYLVTDGRQLYFHRNSVIDDGGQPLAVGDEVRFAEGRGDKGPQATSVARVGEHGHHELQHP